MRPGSALLLAGLLLAAGAVFFLAEAGLAVDGATGVPVLSGAAAGGAAVAVAVSRLLQRHGPVPGRLPLLGLLTAPLWSRLPELAEVAVLAAFGGYFAGLLGLLARRARRLRVSQRS